MLDWSRIDTVLLDMDGTLLDLRFDAQFWLDHMPRHFAAHHGLDDADARARLDLLFEHARDRLEYYCLDWWSEATGLDIVGLKRDLVHLIRFRPHAEAFMSAVRTSGRRACIVTNSHRAGFDLKHAHTGIGDLVDAVISAHDHAEPKESARFWSCVQADLGFEPARTLLIDDNLKALDAAARFGIAHLRAVAQPDSGQPPLTGLPYAAVDDFSLLAPVVPRETAS
ncbi:MAG: GMP/IMP nucleotidase [Pseudomonadales bacterium]|jgi:putative hydrolase of the HAD superfamily|nr:GMP/IMP nucleotidase [Pseudomonadales bacterium]